jgi:hypothetical protein
MAVRTEQHVPNVHCAVHFRRAGRCLRQGINVNSTPSCSCTVPLYRWASGVVPILLAKEKADLDALTKSVSTLKKHGNKKG